MARWEACPECDSRPEPFSESILMEPMIAFQRFHFLLHGGDFILGNPMRRRTAGRIAQRCRVSHVIQPYLAMLMRQHTKVI